MSKPTAQAIVPTAEGSAAGAGGHDRARSPRDPRSPRWGEQTPRRVEAALGPRATSVTVRNAAGIGAATVAGHQGSSDEAWERLYLEAYPKLFAYACRRLPTAEHARDAVAEATVRAIAGFGTWRGEGGGLLAWLYGILRHVVVDAQRAAARERPARHRDLLTSEPLHEPHADEPLLWREDAERLRKAFARLTPDEQEVLHLRVATGLSADDTATELGRRPGAVRMAQSRALAHLRRLLSTDVDTEPVRPPTPPTSRRDHSATRPGGSLRTGPCLDARSQHALTKNR